MLSRNDQPHYPPPRSLATALRELALNGNEMITIGEIELRLGDRSFATLMVFFAAINTVPAPFGASTILGIPLIILCFQMLLGARAPWLPKRIRDYSIRRTTLVRFEDRVIPWLERFEKIVKPRSWPFDRLRGERVIGGIGLFMAVLLVAPVPLGNWLPAFGLFLTGLALTERDGVMLMFATLVNVVATVVFFSVLASIGVAVLHVFG
ncbi:MAG: exopolysaccharide biosynthesis protein [Rhizobiaceae bacterium]